MACCSEFQTECLRVVTIGYLKDFIGTNIQDASGNTVYVKSTYTDNTYCPTAKELKDGSIIQNWSQGTTPNGDTDGIVIGGTYANDQLVRQENLSLKYTRFSGLTISATKTTGLSECGESTALSYAHKYIRYTKSMNAECNVLAASTAETSDSTCGELTWHTTYGSVSNCNSYTIPKNGTVSAESRDDSVYASVVFRRSTNNSNTLTMKQKALSGSYSTEVAGSYEKVKTGLTCVASPSTLKVYGTNVGEQCTINSTVSLVGTGTYDEYKASAWTDSCGVVYSDLTKRRRITEGATEAAGSTSYTFNHTVSCCDTDTTWTQPLSIEYGDYSCLKTFTGVCLSCTCEHCTCSTVGLGVQVSEVASSSRVAVATYSASECSGTWQVTGLRSGTDFLTNFEFSNGYIYASVGLNNDSEDERQAQYNVAVINGGTVECSDYFTVYQRGKEIAPVPDVQRGTDNGSDFINGQWWSHPMSIGAGGGRDSDSCYVDTLYYCGLDGNMREPLTAHTASNPIVVNEWVKLWWSSAPGEEAGWYYSETDPHHRFYGGIFYEISPNNSTEFRTVTWYYATDQTSIIDAVTYDWSPSTGYDYDHPHPSAKYGYYPTDKWQYEFVQPGKGKYLDHWNSSCTDHHSYWNKERDCGTPCPCDPGTCKGYTGEHNCNT